MTAVRPGKVIAIIAAVIVLFVLGFVIGYFTSPRSDDDDEATVSCDMSLQEIAEKRRKEEETKTKFHDNLYESLNAEEIGKNLRYFSKHPHVGGRPQSKKLANEIERRWLEYGFDKVEQPKYNVLLPYASPNISNKVQIVLENNTVEREFSGKEKIADPSEDDPDRIAPMLGYAKPGEASGTLLYVNYGRQKDFDVLKNILKIADCKGKIVIMRYGKSYRGDMVYHAQLCGAAGAILYNDPADYAPHGENETYPEYIWLPKTGVEIGTIFRGDGDPLTPGLPSVDGIFRIPEGNARGLPKIPAIPMPYGDAKEILRIMEGDDVPESWMGKLAIRYNLGNGGLKNNKTIKIQVNFPSKRQDIYNVIGTIYGREEPDRWVLIGNHRDAWGCGAVDASSGTAVMMEISRGLKDLLKNGWRPRRTIKFCSWGGEESGLIGSTEWVEQNERVLSTKAITYINIDIACDGNHTMRINGSPLLQSFTFDEARKVEDPHVRNNDEKITVYERIFETSSPNSTIRYGKLGAGSDYAPFYQFVGVPSVDLSYAGRVFYPVYHTVHDTYKWLQGLVDPHFSFHLTCARLAAKLLVNAADSLVLPFDAVHYGKALNDSLKGLKESYGKELEKNNVTLIFIEKAIYNFTIQAGKLTEEKESAISKKSDIKLRDLNDRMVNVEKAFMLSTSLPNQPHSRHIIFAPSYINGTASFPGISELMFLSNKTTKDWEDIKRQVSIVFKAISTARDTMVPDGK